MDPFFLGSVAASAFAGMVGVEVIKKLLMDKIFPAQDFNTEDRVLLRQNAALITQLNSTVVTLADKVKSLYELHDIKDPDGVPLVFTPRSWNETQKENLSITKDLVHSQKETARALEGVTKIVEKLTEKVIEISIRSQ